MQLNTFYLYILYLYQQQERIINHSSYIMNSFFLFKIINLRDNWLVLKNKYYCSHYKQVPYELNYWSSNGSFKKIRIKMNKTDYTKMM